MNSQKKDAILKKLMDPKRIAYAIIGITSQSVVNISGYAAMVALDSVMHFYLVIV